MKFKFLLSLSALFLFFLIGFSSCKSTQTSIKTSKKSALIGSWEMVEVHWKTKDTVYSIPKAQYGLFIFEENRYSIMWTPIDTLRTPFINLSKPTDEEKMAGFSSVVFNGGTYTMTDSTVTTTALIAKVPGFEGGKQLYRYTIKGDLLRLVFFDEIYPNGKKPEWYGKYVTEFVMRKAK
ncbi:lipocalin-like domain-containing protein [Bernardetia sp. Wsw4-3y2]|uniref:lipocalin-like domain-containing protein n=1 Tax=Bernardetia sp. Wsw4-3y2 TaxID=3127471 RepID=UPI0030D0DD10